MIDQQTLTFRTRGRGTEGPDDVAAHAREILTSTQ